MIRLRLPTPSLLRLIAALALVLATVSPAALAVASSGRSPQRGLSTSRPTTGTLGWNQIPTMPTARGDAGLVYDSATQTDVLFGGGGEDELSKGQSSYQDTWTLSGSAWTHLTPSTSPPAWPTPLMAYDAANNTVVLLDGAPYPSPTWVWDGANWAQKVTPTSPPATGALVYDAAHQDLVLFTGDSSQTWLWDGSVWTEVLPANAPSPRFEFGLTYDAALGEVVLFGGFDQNTNLGDGDTWVWTGTNWVQQFPKAAPSGRGGLAMAYDSTSARVVLFGGVPDVLGYDQGFNDTWTWDGTTWSKQRPATAPLGRVGASLADDPPAGGVVMFGGGRLIGGGLDDTWTWTGSNWVEVIPAPSLRYQPAMAYDPATQTTVLFGGCCATKAAPYGDTWTWNGSVWTKLSPATSPLPRYGAAMAYDPGSGKVVMFGGCATQGFLPTLLGDTWTWDGTTWKLLDFSMRHHPSPRCGASLTSLNGTAPGRPTMLLFGGGNQIDTWEWIGSRWKPVTPSVLPPGRSDAALAPTSSPGGAVLFGGTLAIGGAAGSDTWTWDGTTWTEQFPSAVPPAATSPTLAYDTAIGQAVLYDGGNQSQTFDGLTGQTWEWSGTTWTQLQTGNSPWTLFLEAATYDPARNQVVVFGGQNWENSYEDDTWVLSP